MLVGVVSLFADMTYEGARSATGPFLAILGASGLAVGIAAGLGELVGYAVRLLSGILADRTGRYWLLTIVGYAVNVLAVPLLALAGRWEVADGLMVAERLGKAIRTPARDAMLSHATHSVGHGWGFGLHEALDQTGAVTGPLIVAAVVAWGGGYRTGFAVLLVPALLTLATVLTARFFFSHPRELEPVTPSGPIVGFPKRYWLYLVAAALIAEGYADFPLIGFHFGKMRIVSAEMIPILYAVAMGVDALAALAFGRLFDRFGLPVLAVSSILSAGFAPLVFQGGTEASAMAGMVLWGIGMGAQESILRAAIAGMIPADRRGEAYGMFNAAYGLSWFVGSVVMGWLYDRNIPLLVGFSIAAQLLAVPLFLLLARRPRVS